MTENHNHDKELLDAVEALLQEGQSASDPMLDDLAATVPQARSDFRQRLEEELIAVLTENSERTDLMDQSHLEKFGEKQKRGKRSLPLTLAAALFSLVLGGLAIFAANAPAAINSSISGAAQENVTANPSTLEYPWLTATAIIARATAFAAEAQFATAETQLQAAQQQETENALVNGPWTATPIPFLTQVNIVPSGIMSAGGCLPVVLKVYADPGGDSLSLGQIVLNEATSYEVEGTLQMNRGGEWLLINFETDSGEALRGWVQAEIIRAACQRIISAVTSVEATAAMMMLEPTVPPPGFSTLPTLTFTPLPTLTMTPTITWTPAATSVADGLAEVQIRVGDAETLDLEALTGAQVDLFIAVGEAPDFTIFPVARNVTVKEFVEVPMPGDTRYIFIDAIIIPRTLEQAELLAGLATTKMEMKLVPVN